MTPLENILKILDGNEREVRKLRKTVDEVNAFEPELLALTDSQVHERAVGMRSRIQETLAKKLTPEELQEKGQEYYLALQDVLNSILPEVFALVREASRRTLGGGRPPQDPHAMRHFDVQLMGGIVLHQGRIAEMKTGEGKTLVATLPVSLNALSGDGVHLATVNDYLAKRDARWNGPVYHMLGLSVAVIQHDASYLYDPDFETEDESLNHLRPVTRREAYLADITYGTHAEYGFDYLRDNLEFDVNALQQRPLNYAIVDEVDSILIDEARTPLIISGFAEESTELYTRVDRVVRQLTEERDYKVDEKQRTATLTEEGVDRVEHGMGIANLADDMRVMGIVNASLKAHFIFRKDTDYVVYQHKGENGHAGEQEIVIVDEFTGRLMFGRRYSEGLHQAIEAKENVRVQHESQTIATITYQNYFRMYKKLAGMTGTAKTEENEFRKIYNLDVLQIPTNREVIRKDYPDVIYKTEEAKLRGASLEIMQLFCRRQPVLVGTRSIEVSERLSDRLNAENLQILALITLLRDQLNSAKNIAKEDAAKKNELLNRKIIYVPDRPRLSGEERRQRLESVRDLWPAARDLGVSTDIMAAENISKLAELLEIENQDRLRLALTEGIAHSVLNAKYHEQEAQIITEAGRAGAITIATNMAGRGVDIILGGTPAINPNSEAEGEEVRRLGGLHILGTERHESRRIDNQLRGRAGRQGDPGSSRFYLSLEDEVWRLFGDRGHWMLGSWPEDEPVEAKLLSKAIARAQKKVEERNFGIREHTLKYDDVMNEQRRVIYQQRRQILLSGREWDGITYPAVDLRSNIFNYLEEMVNSAISTHCPEADPQQWDIPLLYRTLHDYFEVSRFLPEDDFYGKTLEEIHDQVIDAAERVYDERERLFTPDIIRELERAITLHVVNEKWVAHLDAMDYLREGIHLRAYAQVDPLVAYTKEAYEMWQVLQSDIEQEIVKWAFYARPATPQVEQKNYHYVESGGEATEEQPRTVRKKGQGGPQRSVPVRQR
ncbi:MAG TPA: preprotein translocase subunit SecA [Armatimonadota bacterium]|nr:preprotein translocase subunit SecA [Armatimonadota bacterium]